MENIHDAGGSQIVNSRDLALPKIVQCGSICSCLGTDHWALQEALPHKAFEHVFWCEKEDYAQQWLHANVAATHTFSDVMKGFVDKAPYCDVLTAGFPCQSFSAAGNKLGEKDKMRGTIIFKIIEYIKLQQPRIIVLENVRGLITHHQQTFDKIVRQLETIKDDTTNLQCYDVHWKLLDTLTHGLVPQHRERVYIVALKRCGRSSVSFKWPSAEMPVELHVVQDKKKPQTVDYKNYPFNNFTKTAATNLRAAVAKIKKRAEAENRRPDSYPVIVDIGSSKLNMGLGYSPCLTSSRCSSRGYVWLQTATRLSTAEMLKLEGFTENTWLLWSLWSLATRLHS